MNTFKPALEELVKWDGAHMGGDVAEGIQQAVNAALKAAAGHDNQLGDLLFVAAYSRFAERAAFDLGLMEALPAPAEGEVVVHGDRVKRLLGLVGAWDAPESALDDATRTLAESACQAAAERTRAEKAEAEVADYRVQLRPHSAPADPGLPPCPFCGDTMLFMTASPRFPGCPAEWDGGTAYSICCRSCASHGGWAKSVEGARNNWATCGPGGDRPTPYHIIRERREQELRDHAEKAEEALREVERRLTSPVGLDPLEGHATWCYRVEYHESGRCCCGVADDDDEKES